MKIKSVSLQNYTSLRIGGEAQLVCAHNEQHVLEAFQYAKNNNLRLHILGGGTNTVFKENLPNTLVLKIDIKGVEIKESGDHVLITAKGGEIWDDIVEHAVDNNWWGIENLSYIPGTVGAAPVQNIGAYGVELKDSLLSVRVFDTHKSEFTEMSNKDCLFSYRDSIFKHEKDRYIITAVTLKLSKIPKPVYTYEPLISLFGNNDISIMDIRELVIKTRVHKLPDYNNYPNAGSFFKNPIVSREEAEHLTKSYLQMPLRKVENGYKIPTAWLVEHVAEMKGVRIRNVGTWSVQPLVIVNYGDTTYQELSDFADLIIQKIENGTRIRLEKEVNFVE